MRIAIITDGITPYVVGGMQKHSHYLAKYLAQKGADITLIHCIYGNTTKIPQEKEVNHVLFNQESFYVKSVCFNFPQNPIPFPGHYIYSSYIYSKLIYSYLKPYIHDFDIIYAKGFTAWELLKHKKSIRGKILVNLHGFEMFQELPTLKMKLEGILLRYAALQSTKNADYVISYGGKLTALIVEKLKILPSKILEIPSGTDKTPIQLTEKPEQQKVHFLFVGRYEKRKGIDIIHESLKELIKLDLDFQFSFIGPIPENKKIQHKNIQYFGLVTDYQQIAFEYTRAHILVTPSISEGFPNVIIEAMTYGCAIIATDVGAVSLLVNKDNGWLIKPNVENLTSALSEALNTSKIRLKQKQEHSLKIIERFNWELISNEMIKKFEEIIAR